MGYREFAKVASSIGAPVEQVSLRPQSCAPVVENCITLSAQAVACQVEAGAEVSAWNLDIVVGARTIQQQFHLESRPMPWGGGIKFFFHCSCGQRCAKLYLPPQGDRFACRRCHRLLYWDQRYKSEKKDSL